MVDGIVFPEALAQGMTCRLIVDEHDDVLAQTVDHGYEWP